MKMTIDHEPTNKALWLWAEMIALFVLTPLLVFFAFIPRWGIFAILWMSCFYALYHLRQTPGFSWRKLWHGKGWPENARKTAMMRFISISISLSFLTWLHDPSRFLSFPLERPSLWAAVMFLYPVLSVIPQEIVLRSFFFERYRSLMPKTLFLIAVNAFFFGFAHIIFQNWIAPLLSLLAGVIFAASYAHHRSLKWVTIEHALYGCLIFTIGLGWFFVSGVGR